MHGSIRADMHRQVQSGALIEQAARHALAYTRTVDHRDVAPGPAAIEALGAFDRPLADEPGDPSKLLDLLDGVGGPATMAQTGGRFFGLVNGGVTPIGLAARILSDAWDQNAALYVVSPISAKLEEVCERWLRDLLGLPKQVKAGFVSGTLMATVCGLAAARWRLLERQGWDVNRQGLAGAPKLRIVAGRHAHSTVLKAIGLLGFGTDCVEWVPVDEQGRLRIDALPPLDSATILILQAGNVNSGAFDPIEAACRRAQTAGAWVHIDGAFGLWAAACQELQRLTKGIELAQSWSVDGHKTLNTPYDNGVVLCTDAEALVGALQNSAPYIMLSEERDGMLYTPEMSRRARAVELWATLAYLGRSGVDDLVHGLHLRALDFRDALRREGFEVLNDVVFNQVMTAGETPEQTQAIIRRVQASGKAWLGGSLWFDRQVIRISICSWATTQADVDATLSVLCEARSELQGL